MSIFDRLLIASAMSVAAVQLEVLLADVAANLAECESLAREAARAGAQAIALPEFFTTGAAFVPQLTLTQRDQA